MINVSQQRCACCLRFCEFGLRGKRVPTCARRSMPLHATAPLICEGTALNCKNWFSFLCDA